MEEETTTVICGAMKLSILLAKAKENDTYKIQSLNKVELSYRVLRSVDFRDWHIFKTGSVLQIGSLLAVVDREIGEVMTGVRLWLIGCLSLIDCSQRHGYWSKEFAILETGLNWFNNYLLTAWNKSQNRQPFPLI